MKSSSDFFFLHFYLFYKFWEIQKKLFKARESCVKECHPDLRLHIWNAKKQNLGL